VSGDIWSIGAMFGELSLGCPIFGQKTDEMPFHNIDNVLRPKLLEELIVSALFRHDTHIVADYPFMTCNLNVFENTKSIMSFLS
jgi:hypothetical protein